MNILMMTNTYAPHVGGVAHSVQMFSQEYRRRGHKVLVLAPEFEGEAEDEEFVIRMPAIQNFNGSDFSVVLPIPRFLASDLERFEPDVVHSHHPFFIGSTAVRVARRYGLPLIFTHHTMFEKYTHYVPFEWTRMQEFVVHLSTGYANMCDRVIAPSESVASILRGRGVETHIVTIPTGIDCEKFRSGDSRSARGTFGIGSDSFVVGHVGRLASEKNLAFLSESAARFLRDKEDARFLVVGDGPAKKMIREIFAEEGQYDKLILAGKLVNQELADAYAAMDVFAFSSQSETQGLVLAEAMAAGLVVVALDGPGVREVVDDGENGFLLFEQNVAGFAKALNKVFMADAFELEKMCDAARRKAEAFSIGRCSERVLDIYGEVLGIDGSHNMKDESMLHRTREQIKAEWELLKNLASAAGPNNR